MDPDASRRRGRRAHSRLALALVWLVPVAASAAPTAAPPIAPQLPRPAWPQAAAVGCSPLPPPAGTVLHVATVQQLDSAVAALRSGTTVSVAPGLYRLDRTLHVRGGVTTVAIRGEGGDRDAVVLAGPGMAEPDFGDVPHGLLVSDAADVLIADLTIRDVYYHAVQIQGEQGARGVRLYNVHLMDAGEQLVKGSTAGPPGPYADDGLVACSLLEYTDRAPSDYTNGVDVLGGSDWVVRDNEFRRIRAPVGQLAGPAVLFWRNSMDTVVERNRFVDCDRAVALGLSAPDPAMARDGEATYDHQGGVVRNNMVYRPAGAPTGDVGISVNYARDARILHNTVILNGTFPPGAIEFRFAPTSAEIAGNLTDAPIWQRDGAAAALADNVVRADLAWFVDASSADLHLLPSALQAIDGATPRSDVPDDFDGDKRSPSGRVDVGADEMVPDQVWPTPPSQPTAAAARGLLLPLLVLGRSGSTSPAPSPTVAVPTATPAAPSPTAPRPTPEDCGGVPTFADGLVPVVELLVAPSGDDAAGDGSPERPFASISRAARAAAPGTAIRVQPGTYPGGQWVEDLRGTADAPIWIGGAPEEARPVLEGGGEGLHLSRPAYVVVHDLEVRGSDQNGINCDDGGQVTDPSAAHHVVFRSVAIHEVGGSGNQDCLKLSGLNDFTVVDGHFARCGGGAAGSGIDLVGAHRGVIARSEFAEHSANAIQAKGGSTQIEIRWNRMRDAGERAVNMGGSTGLQYFRPPPDAARPNAEARHISVLANVIEGAETPLAFVGCVDCVAAHNTIIDPGRWLVRILQETTTGGGYVFEPSSGGQVINNLFVFARSQIPADINIGPGTAPETFVFSHNLWYAYDAPDRSRPDLPTAEAGAVIGLDPLLGEGNAIGPPSPAAGAGLGGHLLDGDITGRCYRDPPSIGAYEIP